GTRERPSETPTSIVTRRKRLARDSIASACARTALNTIVDNPNADCANRNPPSWTKPTAGATALTTTFRAPAAVRPPYAKLNPNHPCGRSRSLGSLSGCRDTIILRSGENSTATNAPAAHIAARADEVRLADGPTRITVTKPNAR